MIKNIKINNYKCFKNFEIKNFKRINILVGDNNSGKTSLLEALSLLDPKTFKQKNKFIFMICKARVGIRVDLNNIVYPLKKLFNDYSIFFNKRNIEKSIFIEADFNSSKKNSKNDFAVKFENKIIDEIVDFPKGKRDSDSIKILQKFIAFIFS